MADRRNYRLVMHAQNKWYPGPKLLFSFAAWHRSIFPTACKTHLYISGYLSTDPAFMIGQDDKYIIEKENRQGEFLGC